MNEEEENADKLGCHCTANELLQDDFSSPMGKCTVLKEQICESIQVLHLNVCSSKHIRLLVILNEADSDISLLYCHLICLLGNDTDHISKLALHCELSDGPYDELSLQGRH
jgi:hypothetical protein